MQQHFPEDEPAELIAERLTSHVLLIRHRDEPRPTVPPESPSGGDAPPLRARVSDRAAATPAAIGALLRRAGAPVQLEPNPGIAGPAWLAAIAAELGTDVVFSTDQETSAPFAALLVQRRHGGQHVLDITLPPPGWTRAGQRIYRPEQDNGEVLAEVVPSGLVVRAPGSGPAGAVLPFDPAGWTLSVGSPGERVGLTLLTAAEQLLDGLGKGGRRAARAQVLGVLDAQARAVLLRHAGRPELTLAQAWEKPVHRASVPNFPAAPGQSHRTTAPPPPPAAPGRGHRAPVRHPAAPVVTMSAAPASTVSAGPALRAVSAAPAALETAEPVEQVPDEPTPQPIAPPLPEAPEPEPAAPAVPVPASNATPMSVVNRPSTAAEQTRFTAAAGEGFGEALATVNGALATWPSLRQDDSPGFKADFVAVCLYVNHGQAAQVNEAVRAGVPAPIEAHLPCLASGIRRLPVHRKAVLRQATSTDSAESQSKPGTLLTEPGFLSASMDLDVTVPGAEIDVLIWPATARRTSELLSGSAAEEAIFVAGARFKALALRKHEPAAVPEDDEGPVAPRVAALFRELGPGERPSGPELDERDLAVLAKLERVLAHRQGRALRLVDEPGAVGRLTTAMIEWRIPAASADDQPTVAAS